MASYLIFTRRPNARSIQMRLCWVISFPHSQFNRSCFEHTRARTTFLHLNPHETFGNLSQIRKTQLEMFSLIPKAGNNMALRTDELI